MREKICIFLTVVIIASTFGILHIFATTPRHIFMDNIDVSDMRKFSPTISTEIESSNGTEIFETNLSPQYGFTEEEVYLLAQLLCGDASIDGDGEFDFVWQYEHGQPYFTEMSKVLCVVMNRQRSGEFPDNVHDIVLQSTQFSPMPENTNTTPSPIAVDIIRQWCMKYDMLDPTVQVVPEDHLYFQAGPNLTNVTRRDFA